MGRRRCDLRWVVSLSLRSSGVGRKGGVKTLASVPLLSRQELVLKRWAPSPGTRERKTTTMCRCHNHTQAHIAEKESGKCPQRPPCPPRLKSRTNGLAACKHLLACRFRPVVFEARDSVDVHARIHQAPSRKYILLKK